MENFKIDLWCSNWLKATGGLLGGVEKRRLRYQMVVLLTNHAFENI